MLITAPFLNDAIYLYGKYGKIPFNYIAVYKDLSPSELDIITADLFGEYERSYTHDRFTHDNAITVAAACYDIASYCVDDYEQRVDDIDSMDNYKCSDYTIPAKRQAYDQVMGDDMYTAYYQLIASMAFYYGTTTYHFSEPVYSCIEFMLKRVWHLKACPKFKDKAKDLIDIERGA